MAATPTYDVLGVLLTAPQPTAGNLWDLCAAVDANTPRLAGLVTFQTDSGNSGSVYIGDVNVSTTRYFIKLVADKTYTLFCNGSINLTSLGVLASAATQKVAVGVIQTR